MNNTATFIKMKPTTSDHVQQRLYRLSEPLGTYDRYDDDLGEYAPTTISYTYIVVSASNVPYSGPETYIFGADRHGNITDMAELPGSFRGALDHDRALRNAGYDVAYDVAPLPAL